MRSAGNEIHLRIIQRIWTLTSVFLLSLVAFFLFIHAAYAHSGLVDGYGCHRGSDKVSYHCHEGEFVGRTFKSREEFLRQLRQGKSEQLSPRGNPTQPPPAQKKIED